MFAIRNQWKELQLPFIECILVSFSPVLIDFCNNHTVPMDWEEGLVLFFVGFNLVFRRILFYLLCIKSAV